MESDFPNDRHQIQSFPRQHFAVKTAPGVGTLPRARSFPNQDDPFNGYGQHDANSLPADMPAAGFSLSPNPELVTLDDHQQSHPSLRSFYRSGDSAPLIDFGHGPQAYQRNSTAATSSGTGLGAKPFSAAGPIYQDIGAFLRLQDGIVSSSTQTPRKSTRAQLVSWGHFVVCDLSRVKLGD